MDPKKIIFGPVLSRRLGYSLGIDLLPYKTCNLNCIYCESGKTTFYNEERKQFVDFKAVVKQIKSVKHDIDYLTITGHGEPTLHLHLDKLIAMLKAEFNYPLVVITNSLLLRKAEVREEIRNIDVLMPSLDAVTQEVFEKINVPHSPVRIKNVIRGLAEFRKIFKGKIWLEILFCKGVNDTQAELQAMKEAVQKINPDKVQLNTVVRPPAFKEQAVALANSELQKIADFFNDKRVELIGGLQQKEKGLSLNKEELLRYLGRRPASFEEMVHLARGYCQNTRKILAELEKENKIQKQVYDHQVFFKTF
ncbi:MAG: radical SAM protein [Candidatus Margulisbacteria bacterium]|nr:radical SAM protein [Candidatus Margulisiibacteriota bacterium]